ncbi:hypothetical protein K3N28_22935 [Glycomyces sp. TRM65418]|uniref:hypothetical protein n=1 Tax=Glycomyces sp. TRM65418 TaxID=2867006 RepID=UPI001CE6E2DD|nr:hypothetical protein [Glycomyces sp. TRM65418]MCC3765919.1 hypothetical protein [Glycomyces sp. TRM65418]QZD55501.1 hypothetical protein K3N28_22810 [Glycomyces sp. TRM65418]
MIINVDRSSVAMGDDVYPHAKTIDLPESSTIAEAVASLRQRRFLPHIAGGRATWVLEVNGAPAAVIAQQWAEPKFAVDPFASLRSFGNEVSLMFRYRAQIDPDDLYDTLAAE